MPNHSGQLSIASVQKSSKSDARFWRYKPIRAIFNYYSIYIMSPHAMYFWPKNGQNKNFPRHNTAIQRFKATVPIFWPIFRQIWCAVTKKMSKNLIFRLKMAKKWQKFAIFGQNLENENFFKNPLGTFLKLYQDTALCKKHQNLMRGFLDIAWRTNGCTNGRTDKRGSLRSIG